jgi:flagellar hook-associated protein 3 FlgL
MRVTSSHIIELSAAATSRAQENVATDSSIATSGMRVQVPSDDPVAWAAAQRDKIRQTLATGTSAAIATGLSDAEQTDSALSSIQSVVSSARELAVQGSTATSTAAARANLATQVSSLLQTAVAAANTQGEDGHYLLAGTQSTTQPFDATGAYHGDATSQSITTGESSSAAIDVPGSMLTAANGVDILPALGQLATALAANDLPGIQSSLTALTSATGQISSARANAGAAMNAMSSAASACTTLQDQLTGSISDLVQADTVTAASNLAQTTNALSISQAISQRIISALAPSS